MIRFARDFRLIPLVLVATISLFALKVSGLVFDGGFTLAERLQARNQPRLTIDKSDNMPAYPKIVSGDKHAVTNSPKSRRSWAQAMFNFESTDEGDVTGSVGAEKSGNGAKDKAKNNAKDDKAKDKAADKGNDKSKQSTLKIVKKPPDSTKVEAGGNERTMEPGHIISPGERAVLERLAQRQKELDARGRDLDMRESLLKVAEKRVEAKLGELKETEAEIKTSLKKRNKKDATRLNAIVTMYANMKPKDAARIFDQLDQKILIDVTMAMKPRDMSAILAQMTPQVAERLTVALAKRAGAHKGSSPDQLPKIQGQPNGP